MSISGAAAAVLLGALLAAGPVHAQAQPTAAAVPPDDPTDSAPLRLPNRRPLAAPPSPPPDLPAGADRVPPATITMTVVKSPRSVRGAAVRQTMTRTADRVHVASEAGGPEWLFERNPVDARRVSGQFVDHRTKTIVTYSDSDLELMVGIPGWAHVLMLGCDERPPVALSEAAPTRRVGGLTFIGAPHGRSSAAQMWWNAEHLLPAECTRADGTGSSRVTVTAVRTAADPEVLRSPALRFPAYREVDLAEWLEGH